ncbi:hypothetical protein K470DRAFT_12897 [Piedraia hortae CBS 480.64]|uniref:Uncharacterized protein n=1 Tax=Piedraia hortae CBS 480.64 TaxID=1314780 RepID=A0A6A7BPA3_9PEZI|nr:hypothetical protein K470DRAFT_12897 [Piedraia hortae CBS 480.64]
MNVCVRRVTCDVSRAMCEISHPTTAASTAMSRRKRGGFLLDSIDDGASSLRSSTSNDTGIDAAQLVQLALDLSQSRSRTGNSNRTPLLPAAPMEERRASTVGEATERESLDFTPATLSRAERARKYFELAAEHRRLLTLLPPLVQGTDRAYNPLQSLRNRKLRIKLRRPLPAPISSWQDVERVNGWVDEVEATGSLPPYSGETASPEPSRHRRTDTVSSVMTKPENAWTIEPSELLADAYWTETGDNKIHLLDRYGNRLQQGEETEQEPRKKHNRLLRRWARSPSVSSASSSPERTPTDFSTEPRRSRHNKSLTVNTALYHNRAKSADGRESPLETWEPYSPRLYDIQSPKKPLPSQVSKLYHRLPIFRPHSKERRSSYERSPSPGEGRKSLDSALYFKPLQPLSKDSRLARLTDLVGRKKPLTEESIEDGTQPRVEETPLPSGGIIPRKKWRKETPISKGNIISLHEVSRAKVLLLTLGIKSSLLSQKIPPPSHSLHEAQIRAKRLDSALNDLQGLLHNLPEVRISSHLAHPLLLQINSVTDDAERTLEGLAASHPLRFSEHVEDLLRQRGGNWGLRGVGFMVLEYFVMGVLWAVWATWVVWRVVRGVGRGIIRGVRWVFSW